MPRAAKQMVRVPDELYDALRDLAVIHGITIQAAAEDAIERWIDEARRNRKPTTLNGALYVHE